MKKILIIINGFYPYKQSEDYLSTEVNYIHGFDKVICFPTLIYGKKNNNDIKYYPLPSANIEFRNSIGDIKTNILRNLFFALSNYSFYKEILHIFKSSHKILVRLKSAIRTFLQSTNAYFDIKKIIEYELKDLNTEIYLYSYWMAGTALTASMLKENKKKEIKMIFSRCHRFDVYEYANYQNYIPFRKYILKHLDIIFSISDDAKNYLENKYWGLVKEKIIISRLGTFDRGINISPKDNVLKVVSCSWLRPVKRVDLLFKALDTLVDLKIEWIHYGDGEEMQKIQKLVSNKNNSNLKATLAGSKTNKEIIDIYLNTDINIFINVSESEGVPVSIMEAMSFGKIIIATDVGGTSEVVINGENGYLLPVSPSIEEISNAIRKVYNYDIKQYTKACYKSREIWERKSNAIKNYEQFYNYLNKYARV